VSPFPVSQVAAFLKLLQRSTGKPPQPAWPCEPAVGDHPVPIPLPISRPPPTRAAQQPLPSPSATACPSCASSTSGAVPSLHACKQQRRRGAVLPCVRAAVDAACELRPKGRKHQGRRASSWHRRPLPLPMHAGFDQVCSVIFRFGERER
jgi:hypothetical protein